MSAGHLIVLEGIDGSGKSTQYQMLAAHLRRDGIPHREISFPQYDQDSSILVRAYLSGAFGPKPEDVNAYQASSFYAVDRVASYKSDWEADYLAGTLILCDRYTTSNACHQGSKLQGQAREAYWAWLESFEFEKLALPRPTLTVYLDTQLPLALSNLRAREQRTGTHADIHEINDAYLDACLQAGRAAAAFYGWTVISGAVQNGDNYAMRSVEDIHADIWQCVQRVLA